MMSLITRTRELPRVEAVDVEDRYHTMNVASLVLF